MTMTIHELIALIEAILKLLKQARLTPPAAVKNLHGEVNRSNNVATATLTWTLPTTRVDGSALPLSEIGGVNVFDSASPDPNTPIASILAATTFTTGDLAVGDHHFTVVVIDTTDHKSSPSNVASVTVGTTTASNPSPVTDLAAKMNA